MFVLVEDEKMQMCVIENVEEKIGQQRCNNLCWGYGIRYIVTQCRGKLVVEDIFSRNIFLNGNFKKHEGHFLFT